MHVTHPHPRRALVAAVAALTLAVLALMPAVLQDASFSIGGPDRGAPADVPAAAAVRSEPSWQENPFAWPLLQVPADRNR